MLTTPPIMRLVPQRSPTLPNHLAPRSKSSTSRSPIFLIWLRTTPTPTTSMEAKRTVLQAQFGPRNGQGGTGSRLNWRLINQQRRKESLANASTLHARNGSFRFTFILFFTKLSNRSSRGRKIRCDGAKPMCYNCTQRSTGICEYDSVPKRRGPDRLPGSRQRPAKTEKQNNDDGSEQSSDQISGQASPSTTVKRSTRESSRRRRNTAPSEKTVLEDVQDTWTSITLPVPVNVPVPQVSSQASREASTVVHNQPVSLSSARRSSVAYISPHARKGSMSSQDNINGSPTLAVPRISTTNFASSSVTPPSSVSEPYTPADFHIGNSSTRGRTADSVPAILNHVEQNDHLLGVAGVAPHGPFDHYEKLGVAQSNMLPGDVGSFPASSQWPASSVRSGISTSASPESSSLGEYSSPDVQSAPNQTYVVDARNNFVAEDQYGQSFIDEQLQRNQLQSHNYSSLVSHGTGIEVSAGNEWQKTAGYANERAPLQTVSHLVMIYVKILLTFHTNDFLSKQSEHAVESHLYSYNPYQWVVPAGSSVGYGTGDAAFITPTEEDEGAAQERLEQHQRLERQSYANTQRHAGFGITHPPSLDFVRKTWWDSLLDTFASAEYYPTRVALQDQNVLGVSCFTNSETSPAVSRQQSTLLVIQNLQFLFRNSNFWFAFINVPLFFQIFYNPATRDRMQPALVFSALGMSYFMRSSEAELGADGMARTMWLMDKAQAALEASVHASWIDGELAQAAWVREIFSS